MNLTLSKSSRAWLAMVACAAALAGITAFGAPSYTAFTSVGTLPGGTSSEAAGISVTGAVVGFASVTGGSASHAYRFNGSGMITDMGTLGGTDSHANAVNSTGSAVGNADLTGGVLSHAFLYGNGTMSDLGTLGGVFSEATALNDLGTTVGVSTLADGVTKHAFVFKAGHMTDLGTLGGPMSEAFGINSTGTIVGRADYGPGAPQHHAFLYSNGTIQATSDPRRHDQQCKYDQ